jgi:hypothetical protein
MTGRGLAPDWRSIRWLYDPAGFLRVLSKSRTPVYGLSAPQAFDSAQNLFDFA